MTAARGTTATDLPSGRPASIATPAPGDPRLTRFSLNQQTIPSWSVREVVEACVGAGIPSIGLWREPVAATGLEESARMVREAGLRVSSLCRAGFFASEDEAGLQAAVVEARAAIDEAAVLGAACLPIVPGGMPEGSRDLAGAQRRFVQGLEALVPHAADRGVRLAVEPLHPLFCADRGVICTLDHALDLVDDYPSEHVGVVVDAYHVWWDPNLQAALVRAGDRIASYQVNDWVLPLAQDTRQSRGVMGDGSIDLPLLGRWIADVGYTGDVEVEIFNTALWEAPAQHVLQTLLRRYVEHTAP